MYVNIYKKLRASLTSIRNLSRRMIACHFLPDRVVLTTVVVLLTNLPISCNLFCADSCCGEDFENTFFSIEDLSVKFGSYPGYGDNLTTENLSDTLKLDSMAFALAIADLEYLAETTSSRPQQAFSFLPLAYACSPAPARSAQKITDITITSDQAISFSGRNIPAGERLNEYFLVRKNYPGFTIEEFLVERGDFAADFDELIFVFGQAPDDTVDQSFTFEVSLDDGQFYSLDTGKIIIVSDDEQG